MVKNIPEPASSVQSVFDNIVALNEDFLYNTEFSSGLKNSHRQAKGICAHYKNGELLFGLERMVGFEGMTPEKYTEFKKDKENRYVYRQEASLPREFRSVTQRDQEFKAILIAYKRWLDKFSITSLLIDPQDLEFQVTQNDLEEFLLVQDYEETNPKTLNQEQMEVTIDEYHKVGREEITKINSISNLMEPEKKVAIAKALKLLEQIEGQINSTQNLMEEFATIVGNKQLNLNKPGFKKTGINVIKYLRKLMLEYKSELSNS